MSWLLKTLKRWNTVTAAQMKKSVLIDKILSTLFLPVCFMPCIFYRSRWLIPTILKLKALYSQNMCTFINYWILSWFFFLQYVLQNKWNGRWRNSVFCSPKWWEICCSKYMLFENPIILEKVWDWIYRRLL